MFYCMARITRKIDGHDAKFEGHYMYPHTFPVSILHYHFVWTWRFYWKGVTWCGLTFQLSPKQSLNGLLDGRRLLVLCVSVKDLFGSALHDMDFTERSSIGVVSATRTLV